MLSCTLGPLTSASCAYCQILCKADLHNTLQSRLRPCKRASRSLKAVRARRCKLQSALLTLKATRKQQHQQLQQQHQQLESATNQQRKIQQERDAVQAKLAAVEAKAQDLQLKLTRAEGLVPRLEERCNGLGLEKRKLQGQVAVLTGQVAALEEKIKVGA